MTFIDLVDKLEKEVRHYEPKTKFEEIRKECIIHKLEEEKYIIELAQSGDADV